MFKQFERFISDNDLFSKQHKIILAVSGGADSVVLANLFKQTDFEFCIAHCNFNLRGSDSVMDYEFVKNLSLKYQVPFFMKEFDTLSYSLEKKISIEMAARDLRYTWFEELRLGIGFDFIATAHHSDDSIETYILNTIRGTGIRGLTGIKSLNGKVVRPLLFATKKMIENYCLINNLDYRTDITNFENNYSRNKIRNKVLPLLEEINPGVRNNILENINRFREIEQIYMESVNAKLQYCTETNNNQFLIDIEKLCECKNILTYLYEFLRPFNFSNVIVKAICETLQSKSGKIFYSPTHKLLKDRQKLIVVPNQYHKEYEYTIERGDCKVCIQNNDNQFWELRFDVLDNNIEFEILKNSENAYFDIEKLKFPLKIRKWQNGDFFYPFGQNHKKKLSDFFIDSKLTRIEKDNIWVLVSGNDIIWVIGKRSDNRYRISKNTQFVFSVNCVFLDT